MESLETTSFAHAGRWRPWLQVSGTLIALITAVFAPTPGQTHEAKSANPGVQRELQHQSPLPDFPGRIVTAVTVELAPGTVVGPHRHGGFVYVYLLKGRIRSQMEGEDPVDYVAGQSWIEPAEALHQRTENPSATERARFLAVIYSDADAVITRPEKNGP